LGQWGAKARPSGNYHLELMTPNQREQWLEALEDQSQN
jgi:hypothetical protein